MSKKKDIEKSDSHKLTTTPNSVPNKLLAY